MKTELFLLTYDEAYENKRGICLRGKHTWFLPMRKCDCGLRNPMAFPEVDLSSFEYESKMDSIRPKSGAEVDGIIEKLKRTNKEILIFEPPIEFGGFTGVLEGEGEMDAAGSVFTEMLFLSSNVFGKLNEELPLLRGKKATLKSSKGKDLDFVEVCVDGLVWLSDRSRKVMGFEICDKCGREMESEIIEDSIELKASEIENSWNIMKIGDFGTCTVVSKRFKEAIESIGIQLLQFRPLSVC